MILMFTILFITGVSADDFCSTINISLKDTNVTIVENFPKLNCTWNGCACYVECNILPTNTCSLSNPNISIIDDQKSTVFFNLNFTNELNATCSVTKCIEEPIRVLMNKTCSDISSPKNLKRLLNVKFMCGTMFSSTGKMLREYIRMEKTCIDGTIKIPFNGSSKDYDLEDLAMTVVKIDTNSSKSLLQIFAPVIFGYDLPSLTLIPMEPFRNISDDQRVAVISYTNSSAQQFMINSSAKLMSQVIRIEVAGRNIMNLPSNLTINFTVDYNKILSILQCHFFKESEDNSYGWSSQGSYTEQSSNTVNCSYDHMTPFAVLLVDVKIDQQQWLALSYISYIGCGLSSFFSAASIFISVIKKSLNTDDSNRIHLSLSAALFLLNTSFMFSEWAATLSIEGVCVFVSVIIEYSLLCCFSWMAIEAIHLYLLLIKVFNTHIKHYIVKLSLFGWGVPAVLITASLSVLNIKPFYGTKNVTFSDTKEQIKICWIIEVPFLYGMNLTYFGMMFLFNAAILCTVTVQIFKLRRMDVKHSKLPKCKDVFTVLGLTCLLGMTWGFAFFSSGYTNLPILYLFTICNSLQGLFMFLWIYGTMRKNRRSAAQTTSPSNPYTYKNNLQEGNTSSHHS